MQMNRHRLMDIVDELEELTVPGLGHRHRVDQLLEELRELADGGSLED